RYALVLSVAAAILPISVPMGFLVFFLFCFLVVAACKLVVSWFLSVELALEFAGTVLSCVAAAGKEVQGCEFSTSYVSPKRWDYAWSSYVTMTNSLFWHAMTYGKFLPANK
ncbi:hypothetical protein ACJX0J_022439, partial [Zea mays]